MAQHSKRLARFLLTTSSWWARSCLCLSCSAKKATTCWQIRPGAQVILVSSYTAASGSSGPACCTPCSNQPKGCWSAPGCCWCTGHVLTPRGPPSVVKACFIIFVNGLVNRAAVDSDWLVVLGQPKSTRHVWSPPAGSPGMPTTPGFLSSVCEGMGWCLRCYKLKLHPGAPAVARLMCVASYGGISCKLP